MEGLVLILAACGAAWVLRRGSGLHQLGRAGRAVRALIPARDPLDARLERLGLQRVGHRSDAGFREYRGRIRDIATTTYLSRERHAVRAVVHPYMGEAGRFVVRFGSGELIFEGDRTAACAMLEPDLLSALREGGRLSFDEMRLELVVEHIDPPSNWWVSAVAHAAARAERAPLARMLQESSERSQSSLIRKHALGALAQHAPQSAELAEALERAVRDPVLEVRLCAFVLQGHPSNEVIRKLACDPSEPFTIRCAAASRLLRDHFSDDAVKEVLELAEAGGDSSTLAAEAIDELSRHAGEERLARFLELLLGEERRTYDVLLLPLARSAPIAIRLRAIEALGRHGTAAALVDLETLRGGDRALVEAAREAASRIRQRLGAGGLSFTRELGGLAFPESSPPSKTV